MAGKITWVVNKRTGRGFNPNHPFSHGVEEALRAVDAELDKLLSKVDNLKKTMTRAQTTYAEQRDRYFVLIDNVRQQHAEKVATFNTVQTKQFDMIDEMLALFPLEEAMAKLQEEHDGLMSNVRRLDADYAETHRDLSARLVQAQRAVSRHSKRVLQNTQQTEDMG